MFDERMCFAKVRPVCLKTISKGSCMPPRANAGSTAPGLGTVGRRAHVSDRMLKHYSHIRMKAKREAMEAVMRRRRESEDPN